MSEYVQRTARVRQGALVVGQDLPGQGVDWCQSSNGEDYTLCRGEMWETHERKPGHRVLAWGGGTAVNEGSFLGYTLGLGREIRCRKMLGVHGGGTPGSTCIMEIHLGGKKCSFRFAIVRKFYASVGVNVYI